MDHIQKILDDAIAQVPRRALERRLAAKFKHLGIAVSDAATATLVRQIFDGKTTVVHVDGGSDDITINLTQEDFDYVTTVAEQFTNEQLPALVEKMSDKAAAAIFKSLAKGWRQEANAQRADVDAFRDRLEHRWGKALGKLRLLLTISREWGATAHERRRTKRNSDPTHLEKVLLRLHVRACQITNEIIVLLENGFADGAMARWRTLHEVATVASVIAIHGEEMAERYVHHQVVEAYKGLIAYERDHVGLRFKPISKKESQRIRKAYAAAVRRFGTKFAEEYGWAAHHLALKGKERVTFARLEQEAGDSYMRSPYKLASHIVHAGPRGAYFRLGSIDGSPHFLAGASNAGLTEPAQHTAVSFSELTMRVIGDSPIFDDVVALKIIARLSAEIPIDFWKAEQKLRRDDRRHRRNT